MKTYALGFLLLLKLNYLYADNIINNHEEIYAADTILVKTINANYEDNFVLANDEINANIIKKYTIIDGLFLVKAPVGVSIDDTINFYHSLDIVEYAEPNFMATMIDNIPDQRNNLPKENETPTINDPFFSNQWALENFGQSGGIVDTDINANNMWLLMPGGINYAIGVMDSGVDYNHNDLAANLWQNSLEIPSNGIDDDNNGYIDDIYGINAITGSGNPLDDNNHGTHANGIIGAIGNNGIGISGVMQTARMANCKFLNSSGVGTTADAIECIQYFINLKNRVIDPINIIAINNSYNITGFSQALQDAINAAKNANIIFVIASGNNSADNDITPIYPANYPLSNIISVSATTSSDTILPGANIGKLTVLTTAPGQSIQSTIRNQAYSYLSGTPGAAAYVSGLIGIIKNYYPNYTWAQVKNLVVSSGKVINAANNKITSKRRIRAYDIDGTGALSCVNQVVKGRLSPLSAELNIMINTPINLRALHINCENPNGDITLYDDGVTVITLKDDGLNGDDVANDGVYNLNWIPTIAGSYTLDYGDSDTINIRVYDPSSWKAYNYLVDGVFTRETITGTSINAGNETLATIVSPFPIYLAGDSMGFSKLYVSSNGAISLTDNVLAQGSNKAIPFSPPPAANTLIAPFWDDLTFTLTGANIFYETLDNAPNRKLVLEWRNFRHTASSIGNGTFQVIFYENSPNIRFSYIDTDLGNTTYNAGKSATVGMQLPNGLSTQYSFLNANVPSNRSINLVLVQ